MPLKELQNIAPEMVVSPVEIIEGEYFKEESTLIYVMWEVI